MTINTTIQNVNVTITVEECEIGIVARVPELKIWECYETIFCLKEAIAATCVAIVEELHRQDILDTEFCVINIDC